MKSIYLALPLLLLTACGEKDSSTDFAQNTCEAVQAVLNAGANDDPYASLRGDPVMLGDRPLDDRWVARKDAFGTGCKTSVMRDMFGSDMFTYECELFASPGSLNADEKEVEARQAINSVKDTLTSCLGEAWIMEEDTENADFRVYQKYLFEPESGRPGADTFDFTADPIYIEMSYTPFMRGRGGPTGWLAKVQFQEQRETQK